MERYKNKFRIASARAQWWDYGWNGAYFITICTQNREHFFGEIHKGESVLSPLGAIADVLWHEILYHAPFVELGDFGVMPNHIHGILVLDKPNGNGRNDVVVETGHTLSLQLQNQPAEQPQDQTRDQKPNDSAIGKDRFQNIGKDTVSSIIGSY